MVWRKWNCRKWCDEFLLAGKGIMLASRERRFWYGFVPTFIFFSMLMNLLSGGTVKFELMAATGFMGTCQILGNAFLAVFGVGQIFSDWIFIFLVAFLQGILVGLIVLLWNKKRQVGAVSTHQSSDSKKASICVSAAPPAFASVPAAAPDVPVPRNPGPGPRSDPPKAFPVVLVLLSDRA